MGRNQRKQNLAEREIQQSFNSNTKKTGRNNDNISSGLFQRVKKNNLNNIHVEKQNSRKHIKDELIFCKPLSICDNNNHTEPREYFLHYLCHVCKVIPETVIPCPKCQMITYCCLNHRREHWPVHADICEAIRILCQNKQRSHIMQHGVGLLPDEFRKYRFDNMIECQKIVERPLEKWEEEMFLHPKICESCYEYNIQKLVTCEQCYHTCFCPSHRNQEHDAYCNSLINYRLIIQHYVKHGTLDMILSDKYSASYIQLPVNIETYIKKDLNIFTNLELIHLSELATCPLTVLYSLQSHSRQPITSLQNITVHLIGAEPYFEASNLEKWEIFLLHRIPNIKKLTIVFVGPEINSSDTHISKNNSVCNKCQQLGRNIVFQFTCQLYHEYIAGTCFTKPNIICAFNAGIYRTTGFNNNDTWLETIAAMFQSPNIPVVVTAYTQKEIMLDNRRINEFQKVLILEGPSKNPFSSLKPNINFVSDNEMPVIFKNYYFTVLKQDNATK